ncbi:tripartite tricarboxylate transporter substrate binding protein [Siccirubricoccus sp. KC 17139]|uniref:Tripartite tricarboxylate transporter substrate binding protein n=1 Tax=Siccirubricoccus soli TaxID=2899147 RepID=A0ABT1D6N1_9PROT|nr:tripartite tricarboxylate transporter substrate binding protein [Siccirubricoccus soli]MCO6417598.1 tripartite tricarboxylate transporter substrate binding protein [Siccirubricoccus soli]MCP2683733.1 tripartite tricarboxylate transporter substrate binding protein [Siccirubricoccus soli]
MQRRLILASAGLLATPGLLRAQAAYPNARPVRIIMPSTPGTPQDFYARSLGEHWSRTLGGTFVVENRPGASGTIGLAHVANSPPDGYTLTFNSNTAQTIAPQVMRDPGFEALKSFAPIMLAYKYGMFLLITPSIPARNTQEFLAWARAKRTGVNMASVGLGSGGQLMGERVKLRGGFPAEPIHYRGSPPALLAVAQGECDYIMDNVGASAPLRREGRLRGLALTGRNRAPDSPEIPLLSEEGLPGFDEEIWFGVSAPAGTPPRIIAMLNAEANRWLASEDIRRRMAGFSHEPMGGSPEDFASFAARDMAVWASVVKETGVRAE